MHPPGTKRDDPSSSDVKLSYPVSRQVDIPDSPYYVIAEDKFSPSWAMTTRKKHFFILPCNSRRETEIVKTNMEDRVDIKSIRTTGRKPRLNLDDHLYTLLSKTNAEVWYDPTRPFLRYE